MLGYALPFTFQETEWVEVIDDGAVITTYNITAGQVIFFLKNTVHWIKNVGSEDCFFLLFFSTHEELQTLDVDDVFFSTPEDIASRPLKVCITAENTVRSLKVCITAENTSRSLNVCTIAENKS